MKHRLYSLAASSLAALALSTAAHAQLLDSVKNAMGGNSGASAGSMPDLGSVGSGNIAGVLGYCAQNNYLGGDASGVKDKILGKLGGEQKAQSDPGYKEGIAGVLGGNSDKKLDLSGDGLKKQLTEKVCDQVLAYGKSLI